LSECQEDNKRLVEEIQRLRGVEQERTQLQKEKEALQTKLNALLADLDKRRMSQAAPASLTEQ